MEALSGFSDLTNRTKLKLSGDDRARYLNGQTTNDITKACATSALYSLVTNAKGKIEADIFVSSLPNEPAFLIDAPVEVREELFARLDRYIIADDAELEDLTESFELVHVLGAKPEAIGESNWVREANRFGLPGFDVLGPRGASLTTQFAPELRDDQIETLRIRHGIAKWGAELSSNTLPQEAKLENRAIDFHKGCYVGQEVISRIKSVGRVNRELVTMVAIDEKAKVHPGMKLFVGGNEVGVVTSAVFCEDLRQIIALGYAKRASTSVGTVLEATSEENNLSSSLEIRETPLS